MPGSVIVAGARTPIGKLSGALGSLSAMDLGGVGIAAALERAGVAPELVDYVVMGHVIQAGQGQITARQAAAKAGITLTTPATTINKVCLSGLNAIYLADLLVASGEAEVVVAGGMESMTQAPHLLPGARQGFRARSATLLDSMMHDGLYCPFDRAAMGEAAEHYNGPLGIDRSRQDAFAASSHEKAASASKAGWLAEEIAAVPVPQRKGDPVMIEADEGIRPETTVEGLGSLRPAFAVDGAITAGNASQISDGAAAVVVMSPDRAESLGVTPMGEFVSYGQVAGPDTSLMHQPSGAIAQALAKAGKEVTDIDLFEINEAFAVVVLASMDDLSAPEERVNVNGGAIALGHPIGMSGTRLALTALHELRRRDGGLAAIGLCGGGGQGDALVLRSIS